MHNKLTYIGTGRGEIEPGLSLHAWQKLGPYIGFDPAHILSECKLHGRETDLQLLKHNKNRILAVTTLPLKFLQQQLLSAISKQVTFKVTIE